MTRQSSSHPTNKLAEIFALLGLSALVVLFFWKMIFTNLIVARGDLFGYFYPYRDYAAAALREGRLPLWNPYLFMGAPFLANSQAGFFYPFNLVSSWLEVTRAVNLNIVLHVWIAALGAYAFARRRLGVSILAAWLGGASYSLGGYLGTQVEHFNQVQALAWMPWLWLAYETAGASESRARSIRASLVVGLLVGLMILAGHTQSVFIALVGLAAYALWPAFEHWRNWRRLISTLLTRLAPVAIAAFVGVLLAAVQLVPTIELAGLSPRGGGLTIDEAVSFSLDPRLIGRALLPDYEGALPPGSEFTAFFGVSALVLMTVGVSVSWLPQQPTMQPPNHPTIQPSNHPTHQQTLRAVSVVAALGLFLAVGGFNPVYYALVRIVPGFDLFRAPARWLALFAFAASMLAAAGLDVLGRGLTWRTRIGTAWLFASLVVLVASTFVGANITPAGATGPIGMPSIGTLLGWGAVSILALLLILLRRSSPAREAQRRGFVLRRSSFVLRHVALVSICFAELFAATRHLPYNAHLTAPDALTSLRPSLTQLLVGATDTPPARVLSISDILFDPGDSDELKSIFADQLPSEAYFDLLVASKQKEISAPNLPLYYRLPAVDGYDGGLLPLRNYLTFQRLFLPPDAIQPDGRLREQLESIPDTRWLDLMNVKYVIADKVRDLWLDSVFYDLQFTVRLDAGEAVFTDQVPPLEANALGLVYAASSSSDSVLAEVDLLFAGGSSQTLLLGSDRGVVQDDLAVARLRWDEAKRVEAVTVRSVSNLTLRGAALIDERSNTFHAFVLARDGRFRLAHSGDVKVYENVNALRVPRAFVVSDARFAASDDEAINMMRDPAFNPAETVVLTSASMNSERTSPNTQHATHITHYDPEHIAIQVTTDSAGYLVLTDAWYPGWTARVDGEPVEILRADVYFRAVPIGPGAHRVEFRYEPLSVRIGAAISVGAWVIVLSVLVISSTRRRAASVW